LNLAPVDHGAIAILDIDRSPARQHRIKGLNFLPLVMLVITDPFNSMCNGTLFGVGPRSVGPSRCRNASHLGISAVPIMNLNIRSVTQHDRVCSFDLRPIANAVYIDASQNCVLFVAGEADTVTSWSHFQKR
jgi:hypothetical protein